MQNEWYLWEKEPGKIGVSWRSQLERHCDTFIAFFSGTLEDAIRFAEELEQRGYDVVPKDAQGNDVAEKKDGPAELIGEPGTQLSFAELFCADAERPKKKRTGTSKRRTRVPGNDEAPEQLSLFELFSLK